MTKKRKLVIRSKTLDDLIDPSVSTEQPLTPIQSLVNVGAPNMPGALGLGLWDIYLKTALPEWLWLETRFANRLLLTYSQSLWLLTNSSPPIIIIMNMSNVASKIWVVDVHHVSYSIVEVVSSNKIDENNNLCDKLKTLFLGLSVY